MWDRNQPGQDDPELQHRIARHEAGHAVACVALGVAFDFANMGEGKPTVVLDDQSRQDKARLSRRQWVFAAGAAAERLFYSSNLRYACRSDRREHADLEEWRSPRRTDGWEQDIRAVSAVLERERVDRVATEILTNQPVPAYVVFELVFEHRADWDPRPPIA